MSLEQARAFLYRVLPWDADPGVYMNIHWTVSPPDHKGKPFWNGRPCTTIEEAVAAVQYALTKAKHARDVYVCLSSQARADQKTVNGHTFPIAVRGQQTAVRLKSLFIDLDVKDGAYADTPAAIQALAAFLTQSGIPAPTHTVFSGSGGMHVYWALERAITTAEWQPLANALAEATRRLGLKADTGCTVDSARVLRVPGTLNRKSDPPRPVTLSSRVRPDIPLEAMRTALMPFMGAQVIPLRPGAANVNDELSAGISGAGKALPVALDTVAESCGFVREALATGGAGYDNPLWNLTTLVATFAEDGRAQAHRMASGHPAYTAEETDALYDRKLKEREEKNFGWPSCQSVQNAGCASCAGCPLLAMGKSPLNFGRASATPGASVAGAAAVAGARHKDQHLPPGFLHDANGIVYKRVATEDGMTEDRPVAPYPFYDACLYREPHSAFGFHTRVGNPARKIYVVLKTELFAGPVDQFGKALAAVEVVTSRGRQREALLEFLVSWIQHLQTIKDAVVSGHSYGWSVVRGKVDGFSYGGRVWLAGGDKAAPQPDTILGRQYTPSGDLQPWVDAARLITDQKRPALDVILAMSFGAPLVRFTGASGLLISAYSTESGIGKSTAIKVAQAVWGDPIRGVQSLSDTTNSVAQKLGTLRHLPVFWDELKTEEETNKFVSFAFQLSQGKGKSRLSSDAAMREVGEWQTILLAASNDSLLDYVARKTRATTAGALRVLEYTVPPAPPSVAAPTAAKAIAKLHDNYGHAGLAYAQFLGEQHVAIEGEVQAMQLKLHEKLKATADERYWLASIVCVCAGARFANRIGLTNIDEGGLLKFLVECFLRSRQDLQSKPIDLNNSLNVANILGQYLGAMRARHTITTKRIHVGRGRPTADHCGIVGGDLNKLDVLYVHRGSEDRLLRIVSSQFTEWLGDHGYTRTVVLDALKRQFGVKEVVGIIGGGTPASVGVKQYLLEINLAGTALAPLLEAADGSTQ